MPTTRRELATWLGTTIGTGVLFVTYVAVAGIHPLWLLAAFFVEGSVGGLLGYWFIRRESPFFLRLTQGLLVGGVTALPVAGFAYVVGYYSLPSVGETSSYIVGSLAGVLLLPVLVRSYIGLERFFERSAAETERNNRELFAENRRKDLLDAQDTETAGRLEHAAWMYERLGLLEKAGELRRADRTRVVREERISENTRRVVTVDLNKLIAEARQQGLAIPLKCPQCGSVLRLPLSDSGPLRCAYCGTYLDTQTAVRLLGQALGHG